MDLEETRTQIAAVLTDTDEDIRVTSHPVTNNTRPGDGWVNVTRIVPEGYEDLGVTFQVTVILSPDPVAADTRLDELAGPLMEAVTTGLSGVTDVVIEPLALVSTGNPPGTLNAVQITFTMEVNQ